MKLLCETNLENIREIIERTKPDVAVVDSIQTMFHEDISSAPGSVSQVRESTNVLMQIAKGMGVSIFIVGHVTKEGNVAGPRVLEHMVDTVLYFEGDRHASYRILRAVKNRFGSTNEIGVFEMQNSGLEEVKNPSEFLLNGRPENASGSVVACSMEGTRPILVEIQALVCQSNFGIPRRTAVGTDFNRVNLLMAVLEKKAGVHLAASDAYVNIAGGKYPLNYDHTQLTGPYIIEKLYELTNGDAIISTDVGQHQMWAAQYYKYKEPRTLLTSGGLGTMGYGLGAAIGAKMGRPEKTVVNIAGDGCFRMNMNELATAARCGRQLIQIVMNNHVLGMVRQWQTLFYGKRYSSTVLDDAVDFVKLSEALGAKAIRVTKMEDVEPALKMALAAEGPVVLDCWIDQDLSVFPMVPAGANLDDVFDEEDMKKHE